METALFKAVVKKYDFGVSKFQFPCEQKTETIKIGKL